MAGLFTRIAQRLGFGRAPSAGPRTGLRTYAAGLLSRLTASWTTTSLSANADIFRHLDVLRARSRDLCQNNPYGRKFLSLVASNVVGAQGFTLQATVPNDQPGTLDQLANDAIEESWRAWCAAGVCDVGGKASFRDICEIVIKAVARDGEPLVRKIYGKAAGNPFGFALQLLDVDRIDTAYNMPADKGQNQIRMGVEIDDYGRPVAYWLRTAHPGDLWATSGVARGDRRIRIPASEILHPFMADRPEQLRGVPWMHAAMKQLNDLVGYEEAAIIAARVGAAKMGFFKAPDNNVAPVADGQDEAGMPFTDAEPGVFGVLPQGYDFTPFNPDYPHQMFGEFVKAALRGVASGIDVSYHSLGNDLEGVNYSSIRAGTLEERELWMAKQQWFVDAFLEPVYAEWLRWALAMGQIRLPNGKALPVERLQKFSAHKWQPRRWPWVDPLKDIEAARLEIRTGVASPQMVAARNGVDIEDVLEDIGRFEASIARRKLKSVDLAGTAAAPQQLPAPAE